MPAYAYHITLQWNFNFIAVKIKLHCDEILTKYNMQIFNCLQNAEHRAQNNSVFNIFESDFYCN